MSDGKCRAEYGFGGKRERTSMKKLAMEIHKYEAEKIPTDVSSGVWPEATDSFLHPERGEFLIF